jgi:hypothetical protein
VTEDDQKSRDRIDQVTRMLCAGRFFLRISPAKEDFVEAMFDEAVRAATDLYSDLVNTRAHNEQLQVQQCVYAQITETPLALDVVEKKPSLTAVIRRSYNRCVSALAKALTVGVELTTKET